MFNGGLPNLTYRFDNPLGGGFQHHQIGTLANLKASISYITGAHNMKVGYMGGFSNPSQAYYNFTPFIQYRFSGGVPNQLTQTAQFGGTGPSAVEFVRNLVPTSFYAQDQWTRNRLTLQGGLRYDHILTSYPDSCMGGPDYPLMPKQICYPARSTAGRALERPDAAHRRRLRPVRQRQDGREGEHREVHAGADGQQQRHGSQSADPPESPDDADVERPRRIGDQRRLRAAVRPAEPGGQRRMRRDGQPELRQGVLHAHVRSGLHRRLRGKRPYNWEMGVSVQQEVAPRVGVTVGYYRRWFGNFYTLDNTLTAASDYTQFSVPIPLDPRLPGGGGGVVRGIYNLNPNKVGQVQDLALLDSKLGAEPTENWQGVDFSVNARLRNGLTVQAGTSTGRTLQDNCALRSVAAGNLSLVHHHRHAIAARRFGRRA